MLTVALGFKAGEAARLLTPSALREAGLLVSDDIKISSRYFEEGKPESEVIFTDTEAGRDLLQRLEQAKPGTLDLIRNNDKDLWNKLRTFSTNSMRTEAARMASTGCCGAGAGGTCGCCGR